MFTNALIGVDGRQGGRDAIALAQRLVGPRAMLTLAHVYGPMLGRGAPIEPPLGDAESLHLLEHEREGTKVDAALATRGARTVGRGLHELADELGADLLVVGSSRHGMFGRVVLGDDARGALDGASCALAVAPRGYALSLHDIRTIGLGYDGSPESESALIVARGLARVHSATVEARWVVSLDDVRDERPIPADWPEATRRLVDRCGSELRRIGGIEGEAVYGGPREELKYLSRRVDLLVVGSRNYGPIGRMFHGSVARYLLVHASCPLLALPRTVAVQPVDEAAAVASVEAAV